MKIVIENPKHIDEDDFLYLIYIDEPVVIDVWGIILYRFIHINSHVHDVRKYSFNEQGNRIVVTKCYGPEFNFREFSRFLKILK
jgi:hypothetical protein